MALADNIPFRKSYGRSRSNEALSGVRPKHLPPRSPLDKYFVAGEEVNSTKWEGLVIEDANQGIPLMDERELTEIPDSLKTAMQSLLIVSMLVGGATGGPGGVQQTVERNPGSGSQGKPPNPDNGNSPDSGGDWRKSFTVFTIAAMTFLDACADTIQGKDENKPTAESTKVLPTAVAKVTKSEPDPTSTQVAEAPTVEPSATPETFPGFSDESFYAVPGIPEGFGGEGEVVELLNTPEIQNKLNKAGYAPILNGGGVRARIQSQDGARVCIANLPDRLFNPDVESGEDSRLIGESGVVSYGDTESNEVRVKAVGAVSVSGLPEDWTCVNVVVTDENNPAGWGALRMLVIDPEGNIKAEMPAAFSGEDKVELRWGEAGPELVVNGSAVEFELRAGVEIQPTIEPTEVPPSVVEMLGEKGISFTKDKTSILDTDVGSFEIRLSDGITFLEYVQLPKELLERMYYQTMGRFMYLSRFEDANRYGEFFDLANVLGADYQFMRDKKDYKDGILDEPPENSEERRRYYSDDYPEFRDYSKEILKGGPVPISFPEDGISGKINSIAMNFVSEEEFKTVKQTLQENGIDHVRRSARLDQNYPEWKADVAVYIEDGRLVIFAYNRGFPVHLTKKRERNDPFELMGPGLEPLYYYASIVNSLWRKITEITQEQMLNPNELLYPEIVEIHIDPNEFLCGLEVDYSIISTSKACEEAVNQTLDPGYTP